MTNVRSKFAGKNSKLLKNIFQFVLHDNPELKNIKSIKDLIKAEDLNGNTVSVLDIPKLRASLKRPFKGGAQLMFDETGKLTNLTKISLPSGIKNKDKISDITWSNNTLKFLNKIPSKLWDKIIRNNSELDKAYKPYRQANPYRIIK